MNEFARILWKIVGEKCRVLEKFIIPKELTYSSTLNSVIGEKYLATMEQTLRLLSGGLALIIILGCFQWMDPVCINWLWRETFLTTCFSTILVSTVPTYKECLTNSVCNCHNNPDHFVIHHYPCIDYTLNWGSALELDIAGAEVVTDFGKSFCHK